MGLSFMIATKLVCMVRNSNRYSTIVTLVILPVLMILGLNALMNAIISLLKCKQIIERSKAAQDKDDSLIFYGGGGKTLPLLTKKPPENISYLSQVTISASENDIFLVL